MTRHSVALCPCNGRDTPPTPLTALSWGSKICSAICRQWQTAITEWFTVSDYSTILSIKTHQWYENLTVYWGDKRYIAPLSKLGGTWTPSPGIVAYSLYILYLYTCVLKIVQHDI